MNNKNDMMIPEEAIISKIYFIRGHKVLLDWVQKPITPQLTIHIFTKTALAGDDNFIWRTLCS
jgi:hypothetical protein